MIALSLFPIRVSLLLFCFISLALSNNFSSVPYLFMNSAAVLTPIPGTPEHYHWNPQQEPGHQLLFLDQLQIY